MTALLAAKRADSTMHMPLRSFAACVLLPLFLACARPAAAPPVEAEQSSPYEPATRDYGVVHRVWEHPAIGELKPGPGFKLVAAEITFPATTEKFDLDDVDIFDADSGKNYGSGDPAYHVTSDGRFAGPAEGRENDSGPYRGVFLWIVPSSVKRVNFGYWGDMLFVKPSVVERNGPRLP